MSRATSAGRLQQQRSVAANAADDLGFTVLLERHHGAVARFLLRQTADPELAADFAHETVLAAFRNFDQLAHPQSSRAWLYGIARNHLRTEWRRRHQRQIVSLDCLLAEPAPTSSTLWQRDERDACHERELILRALDAMPPTQCEALLLHRL